MSKRARPVDTDKEDVRQVAARIDAETTPGERRSQLAEANKRKKLAVKKIDVSLKDMKRHWSRREADALVAVATDLTYAVLAYKNLLKLEHELTRGDV
jgi:hypothetical protein